MRPRAVIIGPTARADLADLYDWIANSATAPVADRYVSRVMDFIDGLDLASERGTRVDHIRSGVRVVGFEGRLTIAFEVDDHDVRILSVFRAGQDWAAILSDR